MAQRSTIISFRRVTKRFWRFAAVDDISFDVLPGEIVGFVGVNGAGKTTTINMMLGFTSPSQGNVSVFGKRITTSNAHQSHKRIGYVAGDMELPARLTGKQYINFVLAQSDKDHKERLASLVEQFKPQLNKKISTLSRGNKQKIALVAAFVTEPDLIVLDEPTSGLDPIMQDVFLELIRRERVKGTTVFMSSHYLQEVAEVCSRVLLMKNGRIVEDLSEQNLKDAGGKSVRVVTKSEITAPETHIRELKQTHDKGEYTTTFVFDGAAALLTTWLGGLKDVTDVEVSEWTLEAEFRSLYAESEEKKHEA